MEWDDKLDRLCQEYADYIDINRRSKMSMISIELELAARGVTNKKKAEDRGRVVANLKKRNRNERVQQALQDWADKCRTNKESDN